MKQHRWAPKNGRATSFKLDTAMMGGARSIKVSILVLVLAFQLAATGVVVHCLQSDAEHNGAGSGLVSALGSDGSSVLESSGSDDLLAAESSQPPAAESSAGSVSVAPNMSPEQHKAMTQASFRQEPPQQAPNNNPYAQQQQPPQQQQQQPPQQQPQPPQQQQQQQPQMYAPAPSHQHLAAAMQARMAAPHLRNPFMAAALAGNYGPAQQQIAAAAAASMQHQQHRPQHTLMHHPANGAHHAQQQQQQQPHMQHPAQQVPPHAQMMQQQGPHHVARAIAAPQMAPEVAAAPQMVVQESSVRHNIVPAPSYAAAMAAAAAAESNAIDDAGAGQQQQQAPMGSSGAGTHPSSSGPHNGPQQLAMASSAAYPVIASAASSPSASSELIGGSGVGGGNGAQAWPLQAPDIPKIVNLEVKCEKNLMKVSIEFDKIFNGVIFSKGHYSQNQCVHVGQNGGKQQAYFDISINSCGTQGNTQNGLYGMGGNTGSGTYFENTIVIQYDPNVQEVYDHARKLRCTWHDQYEKAVTFRPFPVDMLDIVRADFAGDNVGCWMQIQVGKGPWASEVAGIVKIGQTMTMVLAIKDEENKFDMLVRNCFAHDGKRGPIELVDKSGCITRPKLMSRFTKIKNFGSSATVLSYAHFQAFKFPDSMEVHFQCTIQICRHQCPEQCSSNGASNPLLGGPSGSAGSGAGEAYSESTISGTFNIGGGGSVGSQAGSASGEHLRKFGHHSPASLSRERRDTHEEHSRWLNGSHHHHQHHRSAGKQSQTTVGLNRIIHVVSSGDLAFTLPSSAAASESLPDASGLTSGAAPRVDELSNSAQICMSSYNFVLALVMLALLLLCSCLLAIGLYVRQRSLSLSAGCSSSKLLTNGISASSSTLARSTTSSPSSSNNKQLNVNLVPTHHQSQLMFH